jgi:hypothetical protein
LQRGLQLILGRSTIRKSRMCPVKFANLEKTTTAPVFFLDDQPGTDFNTQDLVW